MSPSKISLLHQRIIKMIPENSMSFKWIERPSTRRFFEVLQPSSVHCMSFRRQLSGKLLEHAARSNRDDIIPEMKKLNENFNCSYFLSAMAGWITQSDIYLDQSSQCCIFGLLMTKLSEKEISSQMITTTESEQQRR